MDAVVVEKGGGLVELCLESLSGGRDEPEVVGVGQGVEIEAIPKLNVGGVIMQPA